MYIISIRMKIYLFLCEIKEFINTEIIAY